MPAAAVIPAPLAYIKVVAVKTFEVDSPSRLATTAGARLRGRCRPCVRSRLRLTMVCPGVYSVNGSAFPAFAAQPHGARGTHVYLEQIKVLKAG